MIWSMLPDSVDEISKNAGVQLHAPVIGLFAAIGKLTMGFSQLLSGWFLQRTGFPNAPNISAFENVLVWATVSGCGFTIFFLSQYKLSHKLHAQISAALLKDSEPANDCSVS